MDTGAEVNKGVFIAAITVVVIVICFLGFKFLSRSASVTFGTGLTAAAPGSAQVRYLIVSDIEAARDELVARGVAVSEVFHEGTRGTRFHLPGTNGRVSGPAPDRSSYGSFASFSDPDGNGWLFQEVTTRLPGRVD